MATNSTVIRLSQDELEIIEEYRKVTTDFYKRKGLDFNAFQLENKSAREVLTEMLAEALYYAKNA